MSVSLQFNIKMLIWADYLIMEVPFPTTSIRTMNIEDFQTNPKEKQWSGPFSFIQGADTQFGMISSYVHKNPEPNWDREITLTLQAIQQINSMNPKPRFFVVCGDMLDSMPYPGDIFISKPIKMYNKWKVLLHFALFLHSNFGDS